MELRQILEILLRRKWVVIYVFAAIFLTIVIGCVVITPWYDSTAKVLIRRSSAASSTLSSLGLQGGSSQTGSFSDTDRSDYLALAQVKPVADRVITDLNVTRERTRARIMRAIPFARSILKAVGVNTESTEQKMTSEELLKTSLLSYIFPRPHVDIDQYEETDIIEVEATSPSPEQAKKLANAMADSFIEDELKRVREDYKGSKKFIDLNISRARAEYLDALKELRLFKEKEKTVNLDTEANDVINKMSDYKKLVIDNNLAIQKLKASIGRLEGKLKEIPKYQKSSEQLKDNEMVSSLKLTLRDLYLSLAETKTKYTREHPNVIDIENKIAETKGLIAKELEKVYSGETVSIDTVHQDMFEKLVNNYVDLSAYEAQNQIIPVFIKNYEKELMRIPGKSAEYTQLQLTVTVTQDVYNSLLKYQYQIGMAESMALSNIYVVEPAATPDITDSRHKHPDTVIGAIIAIFLGSIFSIGTALVLEYMDDTVRTSGDIKSFKDLTFLGNIYRLNNKESRLSSEIDPRSPLRESFRTIKNSIKFASPDKPLKSLAVTSTVQNEGKSFIAANLAISMAGEGKKVLLIDGDMRRPNAHNFFKLSNMAGLSNYLVGDADVRKVIMPAGVENLSVITTGPIPPDPAKLVESKKMNQLIKEMEGEFDFVILDTPPVLPASDAVIFGRIVDGVVMIVESGRARKKHVADVLEALSHANINIIGAALNKVHAVGESYYYYYQYK